MLQRQQRSTTPARSPGGESKGSPSPNRQSLVGNAAVQSQVAPGAQEQQAVASAMSEQTPTQRGPVAEETPTHRGPTDGGGTSKVTVGQSGALISAKDITLARSADGKGRSAGKVPSGTPVEVLEVSGSKLKVKARSGTKNLEGWVDASVFSNQPALTRDEEHEELADDFVYSKFDGDLSPTDPKGKDTAQGFAGDCFLIASMAAVANASPQAIKDMVKYDKSKGTYTVRFYEEQGRDKYTPVYIEVDAWLPTSKDNKKDPSYAGDEGGPMWSAIVEKAYAKWKGGYNVIGEGGTGEQAMAEITGARSVNKRPSSMKEAEVIPFFEQAKKDGKAIYAGVKDGKRSEVQTPLAGKGDGPYKGKVSHTHRWNEIIPGTVEIKDGKNKAGEAWDTGSEGDREGKIEGGGVKSGSVVYKGDTKDNLELAYEKGKGPGAAADLQVSFEYEGVLDLDKFIIANHAYAFESVVGGKELQFYNPWGTYQPKPISPATFLQYFDSLTTNTPPSTKTQG